MWKYLSNFWKSFRGKPEKKFVPYVRRTMKPVIVVKKTCRVRKKLFGFKRSDKKEIDQKKQKLPCETI